MKDAKGHGSDGKGGVAFNVNPKTGVTAAQRAAAAREMFGSEGGAAKLARIAQQHGIQGGPFKVQTLALDRVGQPWATKKSFRNNTVAETVAKHMRTDGGYMRIKAKFR